MNKLIFTKKLPTKSGFYYWTNFGENTPTVLKVTVTKSEGGTVLYAENEEFVFKIESNKQRQLEVIEEDEDPIPVEGKYNYGDELWCYIPNPYLPGGKKQVKVNCY